MTANAFDEDVQRSLQAGMTAHLSKPVEIDKLFDTLRKLAKAWPMIDEAFEPHAQYQLPGGHSQAITKLVKSINLERRHQVLSPWPT